MPLHGAASLISKNIPVLLTGIFFCAESSTKLDVELRFCCSFPFKIEQKMEH